LVDEDDLFPIMLEAAQRTRIDPRKPRLRFPRHDALKSRRGAAVGNRSAMIAAVAGRTRQRSAFGVCLSLLSLSSACHRPSADELKKQLFLNHKVAFATKEPTALERVEQQYQELLARSPTVRSDYEVNFFHGELLYTLKRWSEATPSWITPFS
jgi:hypothetical protein